MKLYLKKNKKAGNKLIFLDFKKYNLIKKTENNKENNK